MSEEKLAIIKDATYGWIDRYPEPRLSFTAHINDNQAALLILDVEVANKIFMELHVTNVTELNGKPCYVKTENGVMRFDRIAKI